MQPPKQQDVTVEAPNQHIWKYFVARDWHVSPTRALAISMALEAGELLEHYQWSDEPVGGTEAVGEELADVLIYAMQIAQQNNIDIVDVIEKKLEKAALKYPAANFKGKTGAERQEAWLKSKLNHKKTGL